LAVDERRYGRPTEEYRVGAFPELPGWV